MKRLSILSLLLVLVGCGAFTSRLRYQRSIVVVGKDAHVYTRLPDNEVGEALGGLTEGDTLSTVGRIKNRFNGNDIYLILYKGDTALVRRPEVLPEWLVERTTFTLPGTQDKDAWARANYYVNTHAGLKVQVANEFLIETYNATKAVPGTTFSVSRLPQGDKVQFSVTSNNAFEAVKCARYIRTGEVPKDWDI